MYKGGGGVKIKVIVCLCYASFTSSSLEQVIDHPLQTIKLCKFKGTAIFSVALYFVIKSLLEISHFTCKWQGKEARIHGAWINSNNIIRSDRQTDNNNLFWQDCGSAGTEDELSRVLQVDKCILT